MIHILISEKVLQEGIDEVNRRAKSDEALKDVLEEYDGKRIVLNISDDKTYVISIASDGVSLTPSKTSSPDDMYLEADSKTIKKLTKGRIDAMQIMSMVLTGKIKFRNIGTKEIDLVRKILGA